MRLFRDFLTYFSGKLLSRETIERGVPDQGGLGLSDVVRLVVQAVKIRDKNPLNKEKYKDLRKTRENRRLSERYKLKMFGDPTEFHGLTILVKLSSCSQWHQVPDRKEMHTWKSCVH